MAQRKPLPQSLADFYDRFKDEQTQDLMSELCEVFQLSCGAYERCFIVIDALDECKSLDHRKEIVGVLNGLPVSKTSIFVTSRPHVHDIKKYFENALRLDIKASDADIKHYCSQMIEQSSSATDLIKGSLKQQVVDSIASNANGM